MKLSSQKQQNPKTGGMINKQEQVSKEQKRKPRPERHNQFIETPNLDHVRNITGQI